MGLGVVNEGVVVQAGGRVGTPRVEAIVGVTAGSGVEVAEGMAGRQAVRARDKTQMKVIDVIR